MVFPDPIPLPDSVEQTRKNRLAEMVKIARVGILLRCSIILAELIGYVYLNSSALLLDSLSTLVDVASSLLMVFLIKFAEKPPDEEHPFGHGRLEPIAGLQLGILLAVIGGGMLFQQLSSLTMEPKGIISPFTWIIPFFAFILLEVCYRMLKKTSQKQNSPALLADALHYRVDSIATLFAMVALLIAAFFPKHSVVIDHLGAILIALLMIGVGAYAARNNIHQLLDRTPDKRYFDKVKTAALKVTGVLATEKIKLQVYGPDAHVTIDIEVDPHLSVDIAHKLTQKVRAEIQKTWPAVRDVIVHVEPYYPNDHEN